MRCNNSRGKMAAGGAPAAGRRRMCFAAFTLVELMVVIGIIALLISILMPAIGAAGRASKRTQCAAQLHQIGAAMFIYAEDYCGFLPASAHPTETSANRIWDYSFKCSTGLLVEGALANKLEVLYCPTTVSNDLPRAQLCFNVPGWDVQVPYVQRIVSTGAWQKAGKPRQCVMFDTYVRTTDPAFGVQYNANHQEGVNSLFSDGSAIWETLPKKWNSANTKTSWSQMDGERFAEMF